MSFSGIHPGVLVCIRQAKAKFTVRVSQPDCTMTITPCIGCAELMTGRITSGAPRSTRSNFFSSYNFSHYFSGLSQTKAVRGEGLTCHEAYEAYADAGAETSSLCITRLQCGDRYNTRPCQAGATCPDTLSVVARCCQKHPLRQDHQPSGHQGLVPSMHTYLPIQGRWTLREFVQAPMPC